LGDLAFDNHRWELAKDAYAEVFAVQEVLMQSSFTLEGRKTELLAIQGIPAMAAYAHMKLGEFDKAVEILEQGRAQLLRESLERQRRDLEVLPNLGFVDLYKDFVQVLRQYDNLQALREDESMRPTNWLSQIDDTLRKVQHVASTIRKDVGQVYPQYRYFLQALPLDEIQKQSKGKPLVYLGFTSAGGFALVVTEQGVLPYYFPDLDQAALQEKIWPLSDKEIERLNVHLAEGNITLEDIHAAEGGYLSMYHLWSATPY
jgi:tetratricopeptide (TPR) repeat protein